MINPDKFTFLDKEVYENEKIKNLGEFPRNRQLKKYIQRGFIILDKPSGPTSHDVVATVKTILNVNKAGHLGTLDPAVTGVLPIAIEDGTKILSVLSGSNKRYLCNLKLHQKVKREELAKVLEELTGEIFQFPPLKSNVAMKLRKRSIYKIDLLEENDNEYLLDIWCEAGTYIRVLCSDIGKILGVGGEMKELRRLNSASFDEDKAITLHSLFDAYQDAIEGLTEERIKEIMRPIEEVISHIPGVIIRNNAIESVTNGAKLAIPGIIGYQNFNEGMDIRVLTAKGELVALGKSLVGSDVINQEKSGYVIQPSRVVFERNESFK